MDRHVLPAPARRAEIEAVFDLALDLEPAERRAWLERRCANDAELRREVDALLAAHERTDGILDRDVPALASVLAAAPRRPSGAVLDPDRRIGPYKVIRELGRGGMGVVYLAERVDGEYRRQVAIKLLRASQDADELHRRFLAERQILASLSHPNIAQLLDGGTTGGQLPYLVMEYVDGLPITTYCDRHGLDVAARLRLFTHVCHAVHAAHQRLVIHRDLKPSNILVTEAGEVKLLDFGIAKLLGGAAGLVDVPMTRTAFRVMTPEYASPEQVRGEPLSTASDLYALGVILYELVAGRRPYQLRTGAPHELHELVCEREPDRPSSVVVRRPPLEGEDGPARAAGPAAIAASRGATAERLARQLRGDVDAIVMMALRKEPRRRYASAELMSEDIQRFLDGLPVRAHQGTRGYHVAKFLRRHRVAVSLGALAAVSLVGGAAGALHQASVARRERARVEAALTQAEEMSAFLVGLFDLSSPSTERVPTGTIEDALARGEGQIAQMGGQPLVQATMLDAMGRVQLVHGRVREAAASLERAVALRRAHGAGDAELATALLHLSEATELRGEHERADTLAREALARRRAALGHRHVSVADILEQLHSVAVYRGKLEESERWAREALALRRAVDPDPRRVVRAVELVAGAMMRRGRVAEAKAALEEAVVEYERALGPDDVALAPALLRLGDFQLNTLERRDLADGSVSRALAILEKAYGPDHPQLAWALTSLGELRSLRGRHAEAERLLQHAVAIRRRALGARAPSLADPMQELSMAYQRAGRWADAERVAREGMAIRDAVYGVHTSGHAGWIGFLGDIALGAGRLAEAESLYRESEALAVRLQGPDGPHLKDPLTRFGDLAARRGEVARADSLYRRAVALWEGFAGAGHFHTRYIMRRLETLHATHGDAARAAKWRARADATLLR